MSTPDSTPSNDAIAASPAAPARSDNRAKRNPRRTPGPAPNQANDNAVLQQLAQLHPALFGETPRPLKRGIFQDLLEAHTGVLEAESLKAALALHTRSTRYLTVVASGQPRHDLAGQAVEALAPEHVHHALIEVFRRRHRRTQEDVRPKLRQRIALAFEASGLGREAYAALVAGRDEAVNEITADALAESASRTARDAALLRAFDASGQTVEAFADMYGMPAQEARHTLDRARARASLQA
ncbi:ProQ/FinO family protein [Hydrogenophaga sp.]|uniref:ProQ/FinO family protein n=1 Tax=Hydrogenophaga sp. TaxID=1904254 RepID=UPI0027182CC5|nr:ProQ/FinO family protein [Hydrogenophaga sp.]MDO9439110.1 ProQ/FinO family protein [Hydrogenophaga sp.]